MGCKEALITLGDKPKDRWPEACEWLDAHGYDDTIAYVRAMAISILEERACCPTSTRGSFPGPNSSGSSRSPRRWA